MQSVKCTHFQQDGPRFLKTFKSRIIYISSLFSYSGILDPNAQPRFGQSKTYALVYCNELALHNHS